MCRLFVDNATNKYVFIIFRMKSLISKLNIEPFELRQNVCIINVMHAKCKMHIYVCISKTHIWNMEHTMLAKGNSEFTLGNIDSHFTFHISHLKQTLRPQIDVSFELFFIKKRERKNWIKKRFVMLSHFSVDVNCCIWWMGIDLIPDARCDKHSFHFSGMWAQY